MGQGTYERAVLFGPEDSTVRLRTPSTTTRTGTYVRVVVRMLPRELTSLSLVKTPVVFCTQQGRKGVRAGVPFLTSLTYSTPELSEELQRLLESLTMT